MQLKTTSDDFNILSVFILVFYSCYNLENDIYFKVPFGICQNGASCSSVSVQFR